MAFISNKDKVEALMKDGKMRSYKQIEILSGVVHSQVGRSLKTLREEGYTLVENVRFKPESRMIMVNGELREWGHYYVIGYALTKYKNGKDMEG